MFHASTSFVSLFSGCGGFDLGFSRAGFTPRAAFDIDAEAVANYRSNLSPHAFESDLTAGVPEEPNFRNIDAVIAGPPCQGFSTAGRRILEDCRNHLLPLAGRLAIRLRPTVVVIENVAGALAGEHKRYWEQVDGMLRAAGYKTHSFTCVCTRVGMAQYRTRVLLIAWRTLHEPNFILPIRPLMTVREALKGVSRAPNHEPEMLKQGSDTWKIAARIGPGQKLSNVRSGDRAVHTWDIPEVFGRTTRAERTVLELLLRLRRRERRRNSGDADPVSSARLAAALGTPYRTLVRSLIEKGYLRRSGKSLDLAHTFNGKFKRLRWDAPSYTVDTRFGQPRYFLHPSKNRGLTVREAARLQGFPDDYILTGNKATQYRLIGNAVPPPVGEMIGEIAAYILNRK